MSDSLLNFYRHRESEGNYEAKLTFSKGVGEGRGGEGRGWEVWIFSDLEQQ